MVDRILDQRTARGDQRHVDFELFDQRQGMAIASPGGQHHVDARLARPRQRRPRSRRQFVAAVDQRSVDVDGKEAVQGRQMGIRDQRSGIAGGQRPAVGFVGDASLASASLPVNLPSTVPSSASMASTICFTSLW